jgi:hypothetical protein
LIFSISTDLATGLKFSTFNAVLLRADFDLSLRAFLLNLVTAMTFLILRSAKITLESCIAMNWQEIFRRKAPTVQFLRKS